MSKSEKIFPLSTTGGRIQHLCIEKGISRKELYHAILKEKAASNDDSSISRTVFNWYSEDSKLNYEQIRRACDLLKCSSDYLLCLNECTDKTTQFIHDTTGLSEEAIDVLRDWQYVSKHRSVLGGEYGLDFDEAEHYLQIVNTLFHDYVPEVDEKGEIIFDEGNLFNLFYEYLFIQHPDILRGVSDKGETVSINCSKEIRQVTLQNGFSLEWPFKITKLYERFALDQIDERLKKLFTSLQKTSSK